MLFYSNISENKQNTNIYPQFVLISRPISDCHQFLYRVNILVIHICMTLKMKHIEKGFKWVIWLYDKYNTIHNSSRNKLTCAKSSEVFCKKEYQNKALDKVNDVLQAPIYREFINLTCSFWNCLPKKSNYNTTWKVKDHGFSTNYIPHIEKEKKNTGMKNQAPIEMSSPKKHLPNLHI